jgi:D-cysteine desulfhydrase family pyridoxal phosphate-dependent enzyme
MIHTDLPRVPLAHLPTPLEPLPRLSQALGGPRLYVKRDDQTGLAAGGNKSRKLEFLLAEALAQEADCVLTAGAPQSNHCAQTAAAAARHGLRCVLVLGGQPPAAFTGNLLLDQLFGAELAWTGERTREAVLAERAAAETALGRRPYVIPIGGSTPLGAVGYVLALDEVLAQAAALDVRFDRMVVASSSGGTHAGLAAGARLAGYGGQVLGISIDHSAQALRDTVAGLANAALRLLRPEARPLAPDEIAVNDHYLGEGYGRLGPPERDAIRLFAHTEGLLLDPVYTGRAAAGLVDLIRRGALRRDETVLFWHTGGTAALYAYGEQLL